MSKFTEQEKSEALNYLNQENSRLRHLKNLESIIKVVIDTDNTVAHLENEKSQLESKIVELQTSLDKARADKEKFIKDAALVRQKIEAELADFEKQINSQKLQISDSLESHRKSYVGAIEEARIKADEKVAEYKQREVDAKTAADSEELRLATIRDTLKRYATAG